MAIQHFDQVSETTVSFDPPLSDAFVRLRISGTASVNLDHNNGSGSLTLKINGQTSGYQTQVNTTSRMSSTWMYYGDSPSEPPGVMLCATHALSTTNVIPVVELMADIDLAARTGSTMVPVHAQISCGGGRQAQDLSQNYQVGIAMGSFATGEPISSIQFAISNATMTGVIHVDVVDTGGVPADMSTSSTPAASPPTADR